MPVGMRCCRPLYRAPARIWESGQWLLCSITSRHALLVALPEASSFIPRVIALTFWLESPLQRLRHLLHLQKHAQAGAVLHPILGTSAVPPWNLVGLHSFCLGRLLPHSQPQILLALCYLPTPGSLRPSGTSCSRPGVGLGTSLPGPKPVLLRGVPTAAAGMLITLGRCLAKTQRAPQWEGCQRREVVVGRSPLPEYWAMAVGSPYLFPLLLPSQSCRAQPWSKFVDFPAIGKQRLLGCPSVAGAEDMRERLAVVMGGPKGRM